MQRHLWRMLWLLVAFVLPVPLACGATADSSRAVYEANCASCHGADGASDTPVGRAMEISSFVGSGLAETTPEAICEKLEASDKHRSVVKKLDPQALAASCARVKELAAGQG